MDIIVHGAAEQVTGSCTEVITNNSRIIVDCGLIQGNYKKEQENFKPFPFDPAKLDAVILTHAHIDHSGRLPFLVKEGFKGFIYCHSANPEILSILLTDSAYLQEKEAYWNNKKRARKGLTEVEPLYRQEDVPRTLALLEPIDYNQLTHVTEDLKIRLQNAGHILGSASIELFAEEKGQTKKIVFSGDIGNPGSPIQEDPQTIDQADMVFMESTYGNRNHISWQDSLDELKNALLSATKNGGNVIIPAFAVGRTQVLLHYFAKFKKEWGMDNWYIFLDSPMAIRVTKAYQQHWKYYKPEACALWKENNLCQRLPKLQFSVTTEQSMAINRINKGAIIIAGSGMMNGGRIKHHLKQNIWRSQSHLIISGYQAEGTIGRRIVDGARFIKLWGETVKVAANVHTIGGFSAHAGKDGLIKWYQQFSNQPSLYLVHGSKTSIQELQTSLNETTKAKIHIAKKGKLIKIP